MKTAKINIKEELMADIRAFKAPDLAKKILNDNQIAGLIDLCFEKKDLLRSRAMWVVGHCSDLDYDSIKPYHVKLIGQLKSKNLHNGVIRNTLRLFQNHSVPKKTESFMLDKCFGYIKSPSEAIAVRAFAMTVAFNTCKPYPELIEELKMLLDHINENETGASAGLRGRTKNTLKAINKLKLAKQ
ncbi:MAG: hypothetical protein V4677_15125 [Bacteroidota bacterium]